MDLHEKLALVTGATSGIGREAALAFAREGARVVVAGRREKEGHETVALIRKTGGKAMLIQTDVTREADIAALVDTTLSTYGRLDVAFNNAGVEDIPASIHEQTVENYHHIMNANMMREGTKYAIYVNTAMEGDGRPVPWKRPGGKPGGTSRAGCRRPFASRRTGS